MPDHPTAESSERELVAERLNANGDRIVSEWMKAVSADAGIPSADRLTITALRDHFPEMLRELVESVRVPSKSDDDEARETGNAHGKSRWRSGYRLDEVLRELARIREMVLEEIQSICRVQVSEGVRDDVIRTARIYFDTISATSARQFVRAQDAEVILRTNQLEHAYEQVQAATQQMRSIAESRLSLLRAATHELRNAMQPVTLAAETLLEESNLKNRDEIGRQLSSVACRLQALLDRLVKLSSLLSGRLEFDWCLWLSGSWRVISNASIGRSLKRRVCSSCPACRSSLQKSFQIKTSCMRSGKSSCLTRLNTQRPDQ
jgi:signal transduction histidine kinase